MASQGFSVLRCLSCQCPVFALCLEADKLRQLIFDLAEGIKHGLPVLRDLRIIFGLADGNARAPSPPSNRFMATLIGPRAQKLVAALMKGDPVA